MNIALIKKILDRDNSLVFLAGAGISYPEPSCLPLASQITKNLFHIIYELEKNEIKQILNTDLNCTEEQVYFQLCRDLLQANYVSDDSCLLPFEPTFQALSDILGFPVIRFVDLLDAGEPNLHHRMLAYALHKGHSVITTNFDKQIEREFASCFPKETLKVLVTDKEYQEAIDTNQINGVLGKIHGDMNDYNSLALTLEGTSVTSDRTIYVGDDIDLPKARKQRWCIYPKTSLSIPKALFLQQILQTKATVVMGYSGSDDFDIMPILTSQEFNCRGLWVTYQNRNAKADFWVSNGKERYALKPNSKDQEKLDMPCKTSKFFLELFGGRWTGDITQKTDVNLVSELFKAWINRLRLRTGDGLCIIARLYSQRGKWIQAELFYKRAIEKYSKQLGHSEGKLLETKSNLSYILDNLNKEDNSLKLALEVKDYIEENRKQMLYSSIYSNNLLNIVCKWMNTDKDSEAGTLLNKAMSLAQAANDQRTMAYGLRLVAQRFLEREDYKQALDNFLVVLEIASNQFGDLREACLSSMLAGICLAKLGHFYPALQMMERAETYAKHMCDKEAIKIVQQNSFAISQSFQGFSPLYQYHTDFIESARKQADTLANKEIDSLIDYINIEQYDMGIRAIDRLLNNHKHPDLRAFLLFLKSNIYHRKGEWPKEIIILNQCLEIKTDNPLGECNLGIAYLAMKDYSLAEAHLSKAIRLAKGNYPLAICYLGITYVYTNRLNDAEAQLLIAEQLESPKHSLEDLRQHIAKAKNQN